MYECMCKTSTKWKNIIFCILVSDKNTHDLATYIYISRYGCSKRTSSSINFGSRQKDMSFTQKYL